jgi:hypothetical protein
MFQHAEMEKAQPRRAFLQNQIEEIVTRSEPPVSPHHRLA